MTADEVIRLTSHQAAKLVVIDTELLLAPLLRNIGMPADTPASVVVTYLNALTVSIKDDTLLGLFKICHLGKWSIDRQWSGSIHDEFLKDFVSWFNATGWPQINPAQGSAAGNVVRFDPGERSS